MRNNNAELLRSQLSAALTEVRIGDGDALEVAALAGLLDRLRLSNATLDEAREWRDGPGDGPLNAAFASLTLDEIEDRIANSDPDDAQELRADALYDFDELCAAAAWCDAVFAVDSAAKRIAQFINAFPEAWKDLAPLGTATLADSPPLPSDPARRLWQAVEAAAWPQEETASIVPLCAPTAAKLDVIPSISIAAFRPAYAELAAASDALPDAPPWQTVARGDTWELAVTTDDDGAAVFEFHASDDTAAAVSLDRETLSLEKLRDGVRTCPALRGTYNWTIDGGSYRVQVDE